MTRIRFILVGSILGLTWGAALRGYMMQLAGPASTFTFSGTFGIILPAGILVGALLGWAEYQRRAGRQYRALIGAPLLPAVLPGLLTAELATPLPWAWPCPRWPGATPCPAVARSGFGAGPVSSLSAPSSLRLRHPSRTRSSALPHRTAPGPPRWPHRCSRRSPWPAPYQCARRIPFRHRANPGRPARI